jgi:hypothetical protein
MRATWVVLVTCKTPMLVSLVRKKEAVQSLCREQCAVDNPSA